MFARDPEFELLGEAADGAEAARLMNRFRTPGAGPLSQLTPDAPNVTVRVVPFTVGAFAGLEGGFALLDFPGETAFPTEVYAESVAGDLYPESAEQIARN